MKSTLIPALVFAVLLGAGCASKPQRTDWATAVQKAETADDHEKLAQHYDELAQTMQADAEEEKRMLAEYQRRPHRYGKRIKDLRARSGALVRDYEAAAAENREMAEFHRQMASELR